MTDIRLNLACGTTHFTGGGWINLDVVKKWPNSDFECDVLWDARTDTLPYQDVSVIEVYAGFLMLHLPPKYHDRIMTDIHRVMAPGGLLHVVEVDMVEVMSRFIRDPSNPMLSELIWGEQGSFHGDPYEQFDKHCQGFTRETMQKLLEKYGYSHFSFRMNTNPSVFWEFHIDCYKV